MIWGKWVPGAGGSNRTYRRDDIAERPLKSSIMAADNNVQLIASMLAGPGNRPTAASLLWKQLIA
jgi:hypothetical protein